MNVSRVRINFLPFSLVFGIYFGASTPPRLNLLENVCKPFSLTQKTRKIISLKLNCEIFCFCLSSFVRILSGFHFRDSCR